MILRSQVLFHYVDQRDVYIVPLQLRRGVHRTRAGESEPKRYSRTFVFVRPPLLCEIVGNAKVKPRVDSTMRPPSVEHRLLFVSCLATLIIRFNFTFLRSKGFSKCDGAFYLSSQICVQKP